MVVAPVNDAVIGVTNNSMYERTTPTNPRIAASATFERASRSPPRDATVDPGIPVDEGRYGEYAAGPAAR